MKPTLDKAFAREVLRQLVIEALPDMVKAQIAMSKGINYLVLRDRATGQFIKRLGARSLQKHLKEGSENEVVEVWQKDPSSQAFRELVAHTIDLPKQQEQELKLTGEWDKLTAVLRSARAVPPTNPA